jgi:hypothetical protein
MLVDAGSGKRIALWTAVSLLMHVLLIGAFLSTSRPLRIATPSTALKWVELAHTPAVAAPSLRADLPHRSLRSSGVLSAPLFEPAAHSTIKLGSPAVSSMANVPEQPSPPGVSIADALVSARAIARETTGPAKPTANDADALLDRPFLPQLDHALRREAPSERHLANGLIRIVSADGRIYCLQTPPEFARGGPVEMLMVPTNCP